MRPAWYFLAGSLVLAAALRLPGLGAKNLWLDEALTWRLLQFPIPTMIERTGEPSTANPPLYFLLLRGWAAVWGDSESGLRSFSVLFGLIAIGGVYALVRTLQSLPVAETEPLARVLGCRWPALLAATAVALSPLDIYVAQQARAYSLGSALFLWGSWALLRALTAAGTGRGFWLLYGTLALAFCYTHYLALFLIAAQAAFVAVFWVAAWRSRAPFRARWPWAAAVFAAVAGGYFPWWSHMQGQSERLVEYSWHPPFGLQQIADSVSTALSATVAVREPMDPLAGWSLTGLLFGVVLYLGLRGGWPGRFLALLGLLPFAMIVAYSVWSGRSLVNARYLAFVQPLWLAALAIGCGLLPRPETWIAGGVLMAGQLGACVANWDVLGPYSAPGMRACCDRIVGRRTPDEPIVVENPFLLYPALYYTRGRARPVAVTERPYRLEQPQAAQLKREDLMSPAELLKERPTGIWCISSRSYNRQVGLWFSLPGWRLVHSEEFEQENPWEEPLMVEYYARDR